MEDNAQDNAKRRVHQWTHLKVVLCEGEGEETHLKVVLYEGEVEEDPPQSSSV